MDRSPRQGTNKETFVSNNVSKETDLTDTHRPFHPKVMEYMFFLSAQETFLKGRSFVKPQNKSS